MEQWKPIKGYENLYEVSDLGRIKSIPRNGTINKEKILKQYIDCYGYLYVGLRNKVMKKHKVHRLVAKAFISNPNGKPQVNHIDGNKKNNKVVNLEWVTNKENIEHSYKLGIHKTKQIMQCDLQGNVIKIWKSIKDAGKELNIDTSLITKCCKGKRQTTCGFKWRYLNE